MALDGPKFRPFGKGIDGGRPPTLVSSRERAEERSRGTFSLAPTHFGADDEPEGINIPSPLNGIGV